MKRIASLGIALLSLVSLSFGEGSELRLMRHPTLSKTQVVFAYAGDLWIASREGGDATRLTTGVGNESSPFFSPDGKWVAFTGEYDGNVDVYTVLATGGIPKRLTYHPGTDNVAGWTPDGRQILFVSQRNSTSGRFARLFTMPLDGVFASEVPLPMAYEGAYSADGKRLAYTPIPRAFNAWKRYRGGMTSPIWIADLSDSSVQPIPRDNSNDFNPMWVGDKVFFLSDRNGPVTLFAYDTKTRKLATAFAHNGLDIKSAAAGPDAIVYEQFGSLHLFDWKSGKSKMLPVRIHADMLGVRSKFEKVSSRITNATISPTGARAVFEARGEILTVPAEKGDVRNLTRTAGVAERDPSWSPDGKWIAYFSDESGEYALHLRDQKGLGEVKKIGLGNPASFFYSPVWSPDSKKIAYSDKRLNLWHLDIEKGVPVKFDTLRRGLGLNLALVSGQPLDHLHQAVEVMVQRSLCVFGRRWQGNSDHRRSQRRRPPCFRCQRQISLFHCQHRRWAPRLRLRYVELSTSVHPQRLRVRSEKGSSFSIGSGERRREIGRREKKDEKKDDKSGDKAAEGTEEKKDGDKADTQSDKKTDTASKSSDKKTPPKVEVHFENISQRILALPIPARDYVASGRRRKQTCSSWLRGRRIGSGPGGATLHKFDLEKRKLDKVRTRSMPSRFRPTAKRCSTAKSRTGSSLPASLPVKPGEGKLKMDEMEVFVDPREEWKQMYRETWRIERDFFYDPNHHGLDLSATAKKYEPFVDALMHRADLNYLFQEMLGELSVGHLYVGGGDVPDPRRVAGGLLGADYKIENGRYRFSKVYNGENWNPQLRAPLTQPGVNVVVGEYLLAVNGRNVAATDNVYQFFEATANKQVVLRVGPNPDGTGSREVTVVPVANDIPLRNLAWVEENRRKVDQASGGKLAYVYLPDTAQGGYSFFNRYFFSQTDKEGVVVDERFNSGGHSADYIIDYLRKPLMSYWAVRDGEDFRAPFGTIPGPKAMLVNQYSGSGGDLMPWMFRRAGVGPLIGKRTWGGLVGHRRISNLDRWRIGDGTAFCVLQSGGKMGS